MQLYCHGEVVLCIAVRRACERDTQTRVTQSALCAGTPQRGYLPPGLLAPAGQPVAPPLLPWRLRHAAAPQLWLAQLQYTCSWLQQPVIDACMTHKLAHLITQATACSVVPVTSGQAAGKQCRSNSGYCCSGCPTYVCSLHVCMLMQGKQLL